MKATQTFISTLKEAPADSEIISHQLMTRAGMIRKLGAGIYNYMPIGLRIIRKVENIIREEMNKAGAIELLMPVVQPGELWEETGRLNKMGPELLRIKDRHQREFVLQPTSEEVITDIARGEIKSYKQLPINFYQIQTKFRDERRPRFGVMRGREFTMKDGYSFDKDVDGMKASYAKMFDAYHRIFTRLGLNYRAVAADNGAIGGSGSQEFHVIADTGEDAIAYCASSDYAANLEAAEALSILTVRLEPTQAMQKIATPGVTKCEEVATLLNRPLSDTIKTIVLAADQFDPKTLQLLPGRTQIFAVLIRGDHELNEVKVSKVPGLADFRMATEAEILEAFNAAPGSLGPVGLKEGIIVVADRTVAMMSDFVCGANDSGYHLSGVNFVRDLPEPIVADIRNVIVGDQSPDGKGTLEICRGIEVGHVFMLGTRYSESMKANFLDEQGKAKPFVMGCYGIGVTRLLGAAIEQCHDERGILWPESIAPFQVVICPVSYDRSELIKTTTDQIYADLMAAGVEVILDDRGERPGAMFADWELIGVPYRIVVGEKSLKEGFIEFQARSETQAKKILPQDILKELRG
ncbi:proline--tRNA ligase [Polynucleobacter rarus]|uniref:proline--tRNA ligase n=1 Tax=Polynucleobacter rarus TaxID=556055 RepID=UPI000D3E069F|nr:proline--tRNA ligase [Polynucleobacter rarus]